MQEGGSSGSKDKQPAAPAPSWELAEEVSDDEGIEESEETKRKIAAKEPSKKLRGEHEDENHAVYRSWCAICVASRGLGTQHRRKKKEEAKDDEDGPRIFSDYFFMSTDERSVPMLILKFSRSGRIAATALEGKGDTVHGAKFFKRFIEETGVKRFINFSDNEPAMLFLKEKAAMACPGVEAMPKSIPVGDHAPNQAEPAVRQVKAQMRSLRTALESKLGRVLHENDPMLMWIPEFAANTIARYRKGADGKTPWHREVGSPWRRPCLQFGEKIMMKEAVERVGVPKRDWQSRLIEARYVGHSSRNGAIIGLTKDGVRLGSGFDRLPTEQRWTLEGWEQLKGLPWDTKPSKRQEPAQLAPGAEAPPITERDSGVRAFYVRKTDVEKFGLTQGCPG